MGLSGLIPDRREQSVYAIDFEKEYREGVRGVIFDIDNTLVPHDAPATEEAVRLFEHLRALGFRTCIISNNDEARVRPFAEKVDSPYIFKAGKPGRKAYLNALRVMNLPLKEALFLGDQILTDVFGAKNLGMRHALVEPIDRKSEPFHIKLKRIIEKILLIFCRA